MSRGGYKIRRTGLQEESGDRVDWLDAFARSVDQTARDPRTAVEVARVRNQQSIIDQITSIVGRRPQSTVENKVQELQERTGLKEWLRRQASENAETQLPKVFQKLPENVQEDVRNFIRNLIKTHHGNIHVPAVVEEVSKTFRSKGVSPQDVNDMLFEKYISDEIVKATKNEPSNDEHNVNLGKGVGVDIPETDTSNSDVFEGLTPVKS